MSLHELRLVLVFTYICNRDLFNVGSAPIALFITFFVPSLTVISIQVSEGPSFALHKKPGEGGFTLASLA